MAKRMPQLWPFALIVGGVVVLLDNFLLIDVDLLPYWPVLLVALGAQLLLRGDIAPGWQSHTFGITRGSVHAAWLEIESGEVDVQVQALHKLGRLIAGQYTARSRPQLAVRNNRARLRMQRGQTWWLSLANWDVSLARDLPWSILASSFLGELTVNLRGLIIERAYIASGLGNVQVECPRRASGPVYARSTFGNVRLSVPAGSHAIITVKTGLFGRARLDPARFEEIEPGLYATRHLDESPEDDVIDLEIVAGTVFGSVHIS